MEEISFVQGVDDHGVTARCPTFTSPLRLIWSMARQRLPVLQPEPSMLRLTTGLIKDLAGWPG